MPVKHLEIPVVLIFFSESNTFVHIWNLGSYDSRQEKEGSHVTCLLWKRISWNAEVTGVTRTLLTQYG